jgi:hypothetical protein
VKVKGQSVLCRHKGLPVLSGYRLAAQSLQPVSLALCAISNTWNRLKKLPLKRLKINYFRYKVRSITFLFKDINTLVA